MIRRALAQDDNFGEEEIAAVAEQQLPRCAQDDNAI